MTTRAAARPRSDPGVFGLSLLIHCALTSRAEGRSLGPPPDDPRGRQRLVRDLSRQVKRMISWQDAKA